MAAIAVLPRRAPLLLASFAAACGAAVDLGGSVPDGGADTSPIPDSAPLVDSGSPPTDTMTAADTAAPTDSTADDGGMCSFFAAPGATAPCTACDKDGGHCQANGCYDGYYCDTVTIGCKTLPSTCDAGVCAAYGLPAVPSPCTACTPGMSGCQPNGCFNGYYCEFSNQDCKLPPAGCDGGS